MKPNPFDDQVYFDSSAYTGGDESELKASQEVREIYRTNKERIILSYSVVSEMENPLAPKWKKEIARSSIRTVEIPRTDEEEETLRDIEKILVGNGSIEKRKADCLHVFEAQKYGRYFITADRNIYKHAETILQKYGLHIVRPTEFLQLLKHYATQT